MIASSLKRYLLLLGALLCAPVLYILIKHRAGRCLHNDAPRVLIIPQLTRIGDLVCATPVFRAIKERHPESFVAVLVTKMTAGILVANPHIDEIIIYRSNELRRLLKTVRARRFGWSFCLSGSLFGTLVAFAGLIPRRITVAYEGRALIERATDFLNSTRVFYEHHTFLPRHYLAMLRPLGIYAPAEVREVFVSHEARREADAFFERAGLGASDFFIGMAIAAGNKIKEWGDEKFVALARELIRRYDATILAVGGKADAGRFEAFARSLPAGRALVAAGLPLEVLPALVKRCRLFIAVDTGPVYVAHALKIPLVDITGPVDPTEQPPEDALSVQVRPPAHIRPSSFVFKRPGRPEEHKRALAAISVGDVLRAVTTLEKRGSLAGRCRVQRHE